MDSEDADPVGTYTHLIERLNDIGILCVSPRLQYVLHRSLCLWRLAAVSANTFC